MWDILCGAINIFNPDNHIVRAPPLNRVALYRVNFLSYLNTRHGWLSESGPGSSKVMLPTHSLAVRTSLQPPCTQGRGFHFKWLGLHRPSSIPLYLQCVWTVLGSRSHSCTVHPVPGQMSRAHPSSTPVGQSIWAFPEWPAPVSLAGGIGLGYLVLLHLIGYTVSCDCLQRLQRTEHFKAEKNVLSSTK